MSCFLNLLTVTGLHLDAFDARLSSRLNDRNSTELEDKIAFDTKPDQQRLAFVTNDDKLYKSLSSTFAQTYPSLSHLPFQVYDEEKLENMFSYDDYGRTQEKPNIFFAVIIRSSNPNWRYTLRGNYTGDSIDSTMIDTYQPSIDNIHVTYNSGSKQTQHKQHLFHTSSHSTFNSCWLIYLLDVCF